MENINQPLPTNDPPTPRNPANPAIPIRRNLPEQSLTNIDIMHPARNTGIHHRGLMLGPRARVPDPDLGAAAWVGVWVGAVAHHGDGEGDDVVRGGRLDTAGAHTGRVVGHWAGVGVGCGEGGEEEEDGGKGEGG